MDRLHPSKNPAIGLLPGGAEGGRVKDVELYGQSEDEAGLIVASRRLSTFNGEKAEILVRYNAAPLC